MHMFFGFFWYMNTLIKFYEYTFVQKVYQERLVLMISKAI